MTQGARICPHCKRRVDERRAKGLAYCLSCGQPLAGFATPSGAPLSQVGRASPSQYGAPPSQYGPPSQQMGTPPPSQYGAMPAFSPAPPPQPQAASQGSSLGLVIGLVGGGVGLLALGVAVVVFMSAKTPTAPTESPLPSATVVIESASASASASSDLADPKSRTPSAHRPHAPGTAGTATTKSTDEPEPTGNQPFPTTRALERLDEATATAERVCPRPEGPFGTTVVDVTFETDGRVGTTSRKPIGGTPTGFCITEKFLAIRLGAFEGTSRTFARSVTIRSPTGGVATSTSSTKSDAGR